MKFALLGVDEEVLAFAQALLAEGHECAAAFDAEEHLVRLSAIVPAARADEDWEAALLGSTIDFLVVAVARANRTAATGISATERREDQLRKIAQSGVPAVIMHPACEAIVGFEIEMIRRDCQGILVPYSPGLLRPETAELAAIFRAREESPIGATEQIAFERYQADRSRAAVLEQFARDVVLLQKLIGEIRKVNATGPAGATQVDPLGPKSRVKPSLTNLSVHLVGETGASARWSIVPATEAPHGVLSLRGSRGQATLTMPRGCGAWKISYPAGSSEECDGPAKDELQLWSERLPAIIRGEESAPLSWIDACRAMEATGAIDRSLERGRTIELYHEEHTEEQSFKGVMAVGGCLMLVTALGVVFLATIVEGLQLPFRNSLVWRLWPVYLLAPMAVFLLLQLLKNVVKKTE